MSIRESLCFKWKWVYKGLRPAGCRLTTIGGQTVQANFWVHWKLVKKFQADQGWIRKLEEGIVRKIWWWWVSTKKKNWSSSPRATPWSPSHLVSPSKPTQKTYQKVMLKRLSCNPTRNVKCTTYWSTRTTAPAINYYARCAYKPSLSLNRTHLFISHTCSRKSNQKFHQL